MPRVTCPSCKGGCHLCGGAGTVAESVAKLYIREESRATVKIPARRVDAIWAAEQPTKPDIVKAADRRVRRFLFALAVVTVVVMALVVVLLAKV
jgi:hypothetical protein